MKKTVTEKELLDVGLSLEKVKLLFVLGYPEEKTIEYLDSIRAEIDLSEQELLKLIMAEHKCGEDMAASILDISIRSQEPVNLV